MKINCTLILSLLLCMLAGSMQARERMVVTNADGRFSVEAEKTLKGNDGDIEYALHFTPKTNKWDITVNIVADDKQSGLMNIVKSGKEVSFLSPQGLMFKAKAKGTEKLRGTVVASLEAKGLDRATVDDVAAATGTGLQLGAPGCWAVTFNTDGGVIFADMPAMVEMLTKATSVTTPTPPANPETNVYIDPERKVIETEKQETPAVQPTVQPAAPKPQKPAVQGTEFSIKNENGLFKVEGTQVQTQGHLTGNMLRVQESLLRTKQCKTAAMNMSTGGLYIYSSNGYCTTTGMQKDLIAVLKTLNVPHTNITEVALTESNKWVIIYENSGFKTGEGLQRAMLDKMTECNVSKQKFKCVAMSDEGEWVVVTNKGYWCEGDELKAFLAKAVEKKGSLQFAHFTPGGAMLAICKNGIVCHNVPATVVQSLKTLEFEPKVIKFTDDGRYIITDNKSKFDYDL